MTETAIYQANDTSVTRNAANSSEREVRSNSSFLWVGGARYPASTISTNNDRS